MDLYPMTLRSLMTFPWASRYMFSVAAAGAFSRKSTKWTSPSFLRSRRNPPPPRFPAWGCTTARAKRASYLSQNDLRLHFGLGSAAKMDVVEVRWPTGKTESFKDVAADKIYTITEGQGIKETAALP